MSDTEQHNPYESPKSNLVDEIEEKLSKKEYKIFLSITKPKPLSDFMQYIQDCYKELLRVGGTVYVYIDATIDNVSVPENYVEEGKIVIDITPRAISHFNWSENAMKFKATFNGENKNIEVPFDSLLWIYSSETKTGYELNKV